METNFRTEFANMRANMNYELCMANDPGECVRADGTKRTRRNKADKGTEADKARALEAGG